ncbi:MAG: YgaP-like transmembrane domain [Acidobacteriota bacterium]
MKKCNTNPLIKYIRIVLSLAVIGMGIYYKNWVGVLGIFTLISAFTGSCTFNVKINHRDN